MKLRITKMLCLLAILHLVSPCSSLQLNPHLSHQQARKEKITPLKKVPRRLKLSEAVSVMTVHEDSSQTQTPSNDQHQGVTSSGKTKEKGKQGNEEESDPSQYISMDYPHFRKRRPVHNKSLPVGP